MSSGSTSGSASGSGVARWTWNADENLLVGDYMTFIDDVSAAPFSILWRAYLERISNPPLLTLPESINQYNGVWPLASGFFVSSGSTPTSGSSSGSGSSGSTKTLTPFESALVRFFLQFKTNPFYPLNPGEYANLPVLDGNEPYLSSNGNVVQYYWVDPDIDPSSPDLWMLISNIFAGENAYNSSDGSELGYGGAAMGAYVPYPPRERPFPNTSGDTVVLSGSRIAAIPNSSGVYAATVVNGTVTIYRGWRYRRPIEISRRDAQYRIGDFAYTVIPDIYVSGSTTTYPFNVMQGSASPVIAFLNTASGSTNARLVITSSDQAATSGTVPPLPAVSGTPVPDRMYAGLVLQQLARPSGISGTGPYWGIPSGLRRNPDVHAGFSSSQRDFGAYVGPWYAGDFNKAANRLVRVYLSYVLFCYQTTYYICQDGSIDQTLMNQIDYGFDGAPGGLPAYVNAVVPHAGITCEVDFYLSIYQGPEGSPSPVEPISYPGGTYPTPTLWDTVKTCNGFAQSTKPITSDIAICYADVSVGEFGATYGKPYIRNIFAYAIARFDVENGFMFTAGRAGVPWTDTGWPDCVSGTPQCDSYPSGVAVTVVNVNCSGLSGSVLTSGSPPLSGSNSASASNSNSASSSTPRSGTASASATGTGTGGGGGAGGAGGGTSGTGNSGTAGASGIASGSPTYPSGGGPTGNVLGLFNTAQFGQNNGGSDPNWTVNGNPAIQYRASVWIVGGVTSDGRPYDWVAPSYGGNGPQYTTSQYATTFTIPTGTDLTRFSLSGYVAVDDSIAAILVNDINIGAGLIPIAGLGLYSAFTLPASAAWLIGPNTIKFIASNGANPMGLSVYWNQCTTTASGSTSGTTQIPCISTANEVAIYLLNETTGTVISDSSGNHRDGTLGTGDTLTGNGIEFPGTAAGAINCGTDAAFDLTTGLVIRAVVNFPTTPGSYTRIVSKQTDGSASNSGYMLGLSGGNIRAEFYVAGTQYAINGSTTISPGIDVEIVVSWDGTNINVFLNGTVDAAAVAMIGPIQTSTEPLMIGAGNTDEFAFTGTIKSVKLYRCGAGSTSGTGSGSSATCDSFLSGIPIGTSGSYESAGNTIANVFDGNTSTFFDAPVPGNGDWVGLDLGAPNYIATARYFPRINYESRMVGAQFQASSTADFSSDIVTLGTITSAPAMGVYTDVSFSPLVSRRYVRLLFANSSYGNIAELEFYGCPGPASSGGSSTGSTGTCGPCDVGGSILAVGDSLMTTRCLISTYTCVDIGVTTSGQSGDFTDSTGAVYAWSDSGTAAPSSYDSPTGPYVGPHTAPTSICTGTGNFISITRTS